MMIGSILAWERQLCRQYIVTDCESFKHKQGFINYLSSTIIKRQNVIKARKNSFAGFKFSIMSLINGFN